jgi:O-antigen/teichoic acid export membrane protein/glycosyltransferase involved in cell wall biosynthesis
MSSFIYQIGTTLAARIFAMVGPFAVSIITARALGPEERGRYFLVLALAQIGAQIGNLGLQSSNTFIVAKRHELIGPLLANSLFVSATVAPAVTLVLALVFGWPNALGLESIVGGSLGPVALAAAVISPLLVSSLYISNLAIAVGRIELFNGMTIAYSLLAIAAASVVFATGGSTATFLLATAIAITLPSVAGVQRLLSGQAFRLRFNAELFRRGIAFAVKTYLATMLGFVMMRVGVFALQHQGDFHEIGQFSVAVQLSDGLTMLPSTVGIILFPMLIRADGHQRRPAMWRAFWGLGAIMAVVLGAVGILAPWLIPLLFGQAFTGAVILTQAMLPSIMIISLISVLSQYLAAEGFPVTQVLAWLVGLVVQTVLSYWLAAEWGGLGVALATTISGSLVFLLLLLETLSRKARPNIMPRAVISYHAMTEDSRRWIEDRQGGPASFTAIAELRAGGLIGMFRKLRALKSQDVTVAIHNENSRGLAGPLILAGAMTGSSRVEALWPDGKVEAISFRALAAWTLKFANAQFASRLAYRRARRHVQSLNRKHRSHPSGRGSKGRNVLYLDGNLPIGGSTGGSVAHTRGVIEGLVKQGFQVDYASGKTIPTTLPGARGLKVPPIEFLALPPELNCYTFNETFDKFVENCAREQSYAFVYQRMSVHNFTGATMRRKLGIPLILEYNGSEAWAAANWDRKLRLHDGAVQAELASLRNADLVVTVSNTLAEQVTAAGVARDKVVTYPNCIDPAIFDPARFSPEESGSLRDRLGIGRDACVATFIGTFGAWHGVDFLAKAVRHLVDTDSAWLARHKLHFLLIGDGLKMPEVQALLGGKPYADFVTLTGIIPQSTAPAYLAVSDIFLSPHVPNADGSAFFGSPTKLFEYMAMERPIVASDLDQIGKVLRGAYFDGIGDIVGPLAELFIPNSENGFVAALRKIVENPVLAREMAKNARAAALGSFTWRHHVNAILIQGRHLGIIGN